MIIYINSKPKEIPDDVNTVEKLLEYLRIPRNGTGIGINNNLITACSWNKTVIKPEDRIMMISATYGG